MEFTTLARPTPALGSAFSVVLAERVFRQADVLGLPDAWARRPLGHPTRRRTAYRSEHRVTALLAGLACGLRGIAPGNTFLRPNTALQARLGGRFPDQGTIHHWLAQISDAQATAVRDHLHQVVRQHGHFWEVLWSADLLVVDVDGQGLVARGQRFERAAKGWLGEGMDRGYQRYVGYAGQTREVLDEFLAPGNRTLMSQLPQMRAGLDAVIPRATATGCCCAAMPTWAPSATCAHGGGTATTTCARPRSGRCRRPTTRSSPDCADTSGAN